MVFIYQFCNYWNYTRKKLLLLGQPMRCSTKNPPPGWGLCDWAATSMDFGRHLEMCVRLDVSHLPSAMFIQAYGICAFTLITVAADALILDCWSLKRKDFVWESFIDAGWFHKQSFLNRFFLRNQSNRFVNRLEWFFFFLGIKRNVGTKLLTTIGTIHVKYIYKEIPLLFIISEDIFLFVLAIVSTKLFEQ